MVNRVEANINFSSSILHYLAAEKTMETTCIAWMHAWAHTTHTQIHTACVLKCCGMDMSFVDDRQVFHHWASP